MIITKDSKEIRLDGDQYVYIGVGDDIDEEIVDLVNDGLVEVYLDKPLFVKGEIEVGRLHGGHIKCDHDVKIAGNVNVKSLTVVGACLSVHGNLIAHEVGCDDLTVLGNVYVEDRIYCYGSVYIKGDLRSHIPHTLKVTAHGGLHVDGDVDVDTVSAYFMDVNGYLKAHNDIEFCERLKVKRGVFCDGVIRHEEDFE